MALSPKVLLLFQLHICRVYIVNMGVSMGLGTHDLQTSDAELPKSPRGSVPMLLLSNSAQTTPVAVLGDGGGKEAPEMGSPPLHSPLSEPHPHPTPLPLTSHCPGFHLWPLSPWKRPAPPPDPVLSLSECHLIPNAAFYTSPHLPTQSSSAPVFFGVEFKFLLRLSVLV